MAKIIDTIIQQDTAPKQTNVLWDDGVNLHIYRNDNWDVIGCEKDEETTPEQSKPIIKQQSDWLETNEDAETFILNKTHGFIGGNSIIIDVVKGLEEGTPISDIIETFPIQINDVFIKENGNYEIIDKDKKAILSVLLNNPIRIINSETNMTLKVYKDFVVKTLDVRFIDVQNLINTLEASRVDLDKILNDVFVNNYSYNYGWQGLGIFDDI